MLATPPVPDELLQAFRDYETMLIIGHKNPDGDALGSQLALGSVLSRMGKRVHLLSPGPFERHEIKHLQDQFLDIIPPDADPAVSLAVVLDCSTIDRIGSFADAIRDFPTAVIDHHAAGEPFGDITYICSRAFSVTFLILEVIKALGMEPTKQEAELLLFGLVTDTGFFRHVIARRGEIFQTAAELVDAGASPKDAYEQMYGSRPFASKQLLGLLLSRTEFHYGGRLLVTWETRSEHEQYGEQMRDSESLYGQLLSTEGCEAVLYIREDVEDGCTVGLRSRHVVDVSAIAASFGGGGHRRAAGFVHHGDREEIQRELITLFAPLLQESSQKTVAGKQV